MSLCGSRKKEKGEREVENLVLDCEIITSEPLAKIDYISIVDLDNLQPIQKITGKALIALAVRFGQTRLIDNIIVEV